MKALTEFKSSMKSNKAPSRTRSNKQTLQRYSGEWVVFVNQKVVAHDPLLERVMERVEQKGLKAKASVFKVPRKDEGPFVLAVIV